MKYQLIIFDFDGTLADSFPFLLQVYGTVADKHGFRRLDHQRLEALRGLGTRQLMAEAGLPMWKLPRVARHFRALMAAQIDQIGLFDGVPAVLRRLADQGATLAIVSSNSVANVRQVLGPDTAALFAHFDCGASLFGKRHKLRRMVANTGVARARVLCVGDELRDIEAAHAEQLDFAAVTWGYSSAAALSAQRPALLFSSVAEMGRTLAGVECG